MKDLLKKHKGKIIATLTALMVFAIGKYGLGIDLDIMSAITGDLVTLCESVKTAAEAAIEVAE